MDGNGRWAEERGRPREEGHREGAEAAQRVVEACLETGIRYLTLFAFSTENWKRPQSEIGDLMQILNSRLQSVESRLPEGVRLQFVGGTGTLEPSLRHLMRLAERHHPGEERLRCLVAINYGARAEISAAARALAEEAAAGGVDPGTIDEEAFGNRLLFSEVPDPDLLIRTAGEQRLSNFLLWQCAYSELLFVDCLWPEFGKPELESAVREYAARDRRFGQLSEQRC